MGRLRRSPLIFQKIPGECKKRCWEIYGFHARDKKAVSCPISAAGLPKKYFKRWHFSSPDSLRQHKRRSGSHIVAQWNGNCEKYSNFTFIFGVRSQTCQGRFWLRLTPLTARTRFASKANFGNFIYFACVRSSLFGGPLNRACKWILIPSIPNTWNGLKACVEDNVAENGANKSLICKHLLLLHHHHLPSLN